MNRNDISEERHFDDYGYNDSRHNWVMSTNSTQNYAIEET